MKIPKKVSIVFSFIIVGALLVLFFVPKHSPLQEKEPHAMGLLRSIEFNHNLTIGETHIRVAYAMTPNEKELGLSVTPELASDQGMLFIFDTLTMPSFWMKDMRYLIDIIWIDENKTVVGIAENVLPDSYPQTFSPSIPVLYALEVPAGFAAKNNIIVGAPVSF